MNPVLNIINCLVSFICTEGSSSDEQVGFFVRLLQENGDIELIAETGFNTGVSSSAFLAARPDTTVVSFDIGQHRYVRSVKAAIDRQFPWYELVLGNSTETLPAYAKKHPGKRFDLVFIDGGHNYEVVKADLLNFQAMSHDHTIVIMDDLTPWWWWGQGPTKVWQEALQVGLITQADLYKNGQPVAERTDRGVDRIWAVRYVLMRWSQYCRLRRGFDRIWGVGYYRNEKD